MNTKSSRSLASGSYNFSAVATDAAGNAATSATLAAVTDATKPPTVSASESVSGLTNQTSDTITVSATAEAVGGDSITGVNIYNGMTLLGAATLTSGTTQSGTWSYTASGLADGTNNFSAVATDAAGNTGAATLSPVMVATKPPTVTASESVSGLTNQATDTITVTAASEAVTGDSISSVTIDNGGTAIGAATYNAGSGTWTYVAPLADGQTYNFSAVATDAAGNAATSATLAPVTDATKPPTVSAAGACRV